MTRKILCELDDISEPGGRTFRFDTSSGEKDGFIIRYAGQVRAYINSCPHTSKLV